MPCACKLPIEDYPDALEWGPILWTLLHGIAERAGRPVVPAYQEDERRNWIHFLKQTGEIIPCNTCKEHYQTYLRENPSDPLKTMQPTEFHEWVRHWFWEIHEWVNGSQEKPSFPYENLAATYASVDFRRTLRQLDVPMMKAIRISGINLRKYTEWKSRYLMMLSVFGL